MKMVNNTITVLLPSGEMLCGEGDINKFEAIKLAESEREIKRFLTPELEPEKIEQLELQEQLDELLEDLPDIFIKKDKCIYLEGCENVSLPKTLLKRMINAFREGEPVALNALCNFWRWMVLNPNSEARTMLYNHLDKYDTPIADNGFILGYRWVRSKGNSNEELVKFVSSNYTRRKLQKKGTKNRWIWRDDSGNYSLIKANFQSDGIGSNIGNLYDLYQNLDKLQTNQMFTDNHTGTFDIKIGQEVTMSRLDCDESEASCSRGLMM